MSARRLHARSAALHVEVQRREIAATISEKKALRCEVDAETWKRDEVTRQQNLKERRKLLGASRATLKSGSSDLLLANWKDGTGELQRKLMLESARASQRHEEAVRRKRIAENERREASLRQVEKEWSVKEERVKVKAAAQQEKDDLAWKRTLIRRKEASGRNFAADKRAMRDELEQAAEKHKQELAAAIAGRRAAEAEAKEKANMRRNEREAGKAAVSMAPVPKRLNDEPVQSSPSFLLHPVLYCLSGVVLIAAACVSVCVCVCVCLRAFASVIEQALSEERFRTFMRREQAQLESLNTQAKKKKLVYEEAQLTATRAQTNLERQVLKAELLTDQGLEIPASLQDEISDLEKRAELAKERALSTGNEAKRVAEDVAALKKQLSGDPKKGGKNDMKATAGSAGSFF